MEALSFGTSLQRCRTSFLTELSDVQRVLIFGEGDGRYLRELLRMNHRVCVDVVDSSARMLTLTEKRVEAKDNARIKLFHCDALKFETDEKYDAIVTNFFLDCLRQEELEAFIKRTAVNLKPGGIWIIGEFAIPRSKMGLLAKALVAALYLAFRVLTGLKARRLPDFERALRDAGLVKLKERSLLRGILTAELWACPP